MCTNISTEEKEKEERKSERSEPDFEFTLEEMSRRDREDFKSTSQLFYGGLYDR